MAKRAPAFACIACGAAVPRWAGKCLTCGAMNTIVEVAASEQILLATASGQAKAAAALHEEGLDVAAPAVPRLATGIAELDRVLGGGLPRGAAAVLGGEPGIGKSTLLAQVCGSLGRTQDVLYVTAEESTAQVRERCARLGLHAERLRLASATDAEAIAGMLREGRRALVVVDSIQLIALAGSEGTPGSPTQVRACATVLVEAAKAGGTALILVGHVTKDGTLDGPRLLEHLVDIVLSFEGDRYQDLRTLRAVKNRYGSTDEVGLFRMGGSGLEEVADAAGWFIAERDAAVPGSCVVPILQGQRCWLVEVQALVNPVDLPQPQRRVAGVDPNRVAMVLAVLSRRLRFPLGGCEVFVNVTGGARITEPAADLGIALAVASAWREQAVPPDLVALGEVGLGGELRPAPRYELRASEARRLGFQRLIGPGPGTGRGRVKCSTVAEAVEAAFAP